MKKIIIGILIFTLSYYHSFSQQKNSRVDKIPKIIFQEATIDFHSVDKFFTFIDNYIKVKADSTQNLFLKVNNGSVQSISNDIFILNPVKSGKMTIEVYNNKLFKPENLIFSRDFEVDDIQKPQLAIGGKKSGKVSKEVLFQDSAIKLINQSPQYRFKIISFKLSISGNNVNYAEYNISGSEISKELKDALSNLPAGTEFRFEYIEVILLNGLDFYAKHKLSSVLFELE